MENVKLFVCFIFLFFLFCEWNKLGGEEEEKEEKEEEYDVWPGTDAQPDSDNSTLAHSLEDSKSPSPSTIRTGWAFLAKKKLLVYLKLTNSDMKTPNTSDQ